MQHVDDDFIIEAHKAACPEWKKKLENKFPELFEKYYLVINYSVDRERNVLKPKESYECAIKVGDIVRVNDGSYNEDGSGIKRAGVDPLFQSTAEVLKVDQKRLILSQGLDMYITLDLTLKINDTIIFCSSLCVTSSKKRNRKEY